MENTYIIDSENVYEFLDRKGIPTGKVEVTVDIDLQDIEDEKLLNHIEQSWQLKEAIVESLEIEDIIEAIERLKKEYGVWEYEHLPKLLRALE